MDLSQPPPQLLTAPSALATNFTSMPPPSMGGQHYRHYHPHHGAGKQGYNHFKPFMPGGFQRPFGMSQDDFDGKRLRKSVMRKTVDYNASIIKALEARLWQRDYRDRLAVQPDSIYVPQMLPPSSYLDNPANAITTRFVKTATNKMRCPIFTLAWTPEGRRLVTGASSGEFTLWNGLTFNFETILQAHDISVRTMVWSHNDSWMVTGDHGGYVKYWQSNMNNVKMYQAHKEAIRGIRYCLMIVIVNCIYHFAAVVADIASMRPPPNHPSLDRLQLRSLACKSLNVLLVFHLVLAIVTWLWVTFEISQRFSFVSTPFSRGLLQFTQ